MAVRIMPLGDSLTQFACKLNGYLSANYEPIFSPLNETPAFQIYPKGTYFITAPGGYRGALAELLGDPKRLPRGARQLPAWSYVGSQYLCGNHEGYSGETVEWLSQHAVPRAITAYEPDVVLLLAGTNDFFWPPPRGSRDATEVAQRLRVLLGKIFAADRRNLTLLLSTVTPVNATRCAYYHTARWHPGDCPHDMNDNIAAYNKLLPAVAAEYRSKGHDVQLAVQPTSFAAEEYWLWGIHFNVSGFERIAKTWHDALVRTAPLRRAMGIE